MSHIIYSITLVAKDVAHALKLAKELEAAGVDKQAIATNIARATAPAQREKGSHEEAWVAAYGRTRITQIMIEAFGLTGDKESMFSKLKQLCDSGAIVRTTSGWRKASGAVVTDKDSASDGNGSSDANREAFDVDENECV